MPVISLPLIKGKEVDKSADYRDFLPVNMLPISDGAPNADGYFTNHPGIEQIYAGTTGTSNGGTFNVVENAMYRMIGNKLIKNGAQVAVTESIGRSEFAHSSLTTAFTGSNGKGYYWDGVTVTEFKNWQPGESAQGPTNYDLSGVIDVTRNKSRYIWLAPPGFIVTDLQNEQRPDFVAPIYSAESDVDDNVAITTWRDYVVVIGRNSTEFFRLTGDAGQIYASQPSLTTPFGCIATHAKCHFLGGIAVLGSPRNMPPTITLIPENGGQKLSSPEIDKILQTYNDNTLQNTVLEAAKWKGSDILYVHLPLETICYIAQTQTWVRLKSGLGNARWSGIDMIYNAQAGYVECGDKASARVGKLISEGAQYGVEQEFYLQTPLVKVGKSCVYDLSIDSVSGFANKAVQMSVSATENGYTYSAEYTTEISTPLDYTTLPIMRRIGGTRDKIGFRLRMVTADEINISGFNVRIENG